MKEKIDWASQILGESGRKKFIGLLFLSVVSAAFQVLGVGSVLPFLTLVTEKGAVRKHKFINSVAETMGLTSFQEIFLAATVAMVVCILLANALGLLTTWYTLRFSATEQVAISSRLLRSYAYKPYIFFLSNNSASLSRDVITEVALLVGQFIRPFFDVVRSSLAIVFVSLGILFVNPTVAIGATGIFGGGFLLIYILCRKQLVSLGAVRMQADKERFKVTNELFAGQREARLFDCREHFFRKFDDANTRLFDVSVMIGLVKTAPRQVLEVMGFLLMGCTAVVLSSRGWPAWELLPLLGLYSVGVVRLMPQFQLLFTSISGIQHSTATILRLLPELMAAPPTKRPVSPPVVWDNHIEFRELTYRYPNRPELVLDSLSLRIEKNQMVGFVGETGAGKTTLLNLMLGLLAPTSGEIVLDDSIKLCENNMRGWQDTLGFVPQEIFLTDSTIAENIAFGRELSELDHEAIVRASQLAQLDDFVRNLPAGYQTEVGERGVRLSGGQRQRLGIARALYRDPSVIVFDEATSALDGTTEGVLMDAVKALGGHKTVLLVAHRISTLKDCDAIYVLENGKIVDQGTYAALMARNHLFRGFAKV